jgi:hypothetical protein
MIIEEHCSGQTRENVPLWPCLAVTQIHMFSNIHREDTDHLPGKAMGEIDLMMCRMTDDETLDSERIRKVCPSLTFVVEVYDCQRSPNNLSNIYY